MSRPDDLCTHTETLAGKKFVCIQPGGDEHPMNAWDQRPQHFMVREEYAVAKSKRCV